MILVPIKDLRNAKQRLAAVLDQRDRTELAQAMLSDVLEALSGREVSLVSSDPFAVELASYYKLAVIPDKANFGQTEAIAMATAICQCRGILHTLVVPADIPLIEAVDVQSMYTSAPERGSVIVPSSDKRGTNAVLRRPSSLFPLRFGNDSFVPHLNAAIATESTCVVLSVPRIALDIDTPEDLRQLAVASGEKRSQLLARKLGFAEAPAVNT
jgi:2-phospho-L-lactate/phosphoenolpyruvate guanylyltransferase